jgi:hypothetical protein
MKNVYAKSIVHVRDMVLVWNWTSTNKVSDKRTWNSLTSSLGATALGEPWPPWQPVFCGIWQVGKHSCEIFVPLVTTLALIRPSVRNGTKSRFRLPLVIQHLSACFGRWRYPHTDLWHCRSSLNAPQLHPFKSLVVRFQNKILFTGWGCQPHAQSPT